jgi:predicted lipoprotein
VNATARKALIAVVSSTIDAVLTSAEANGALRDIVYELLEHHPDKARELLLKAWRNDDSAASLSEALDGLKALSAALDEADDV